MVTVESGWPHNQEEGTRDPERHRGGGGEGHQPHQELETLGCRLQLSEGAQPCLPLGLGLQLPELTVHFRSVSPWPCWGCSSKLAPGYTCLTGEEPPRGRWVPVHEGQKSDHGLSQAAPDAGSGLGTKKAMLWTADGGLLLPLTIPQTPRGRGAAWLVERRATRTEAGADPEGKGRGSLLSTRSLSASCRSQAHLGVHGLSPCA